MSFPLDANRAYYTPPLPNRTTIELSCDLELPLGRNSLWRLILMLEYSTRQRPQVPLSTTSVEFRDVLIAHCVFSIG